MSQADENHKNLEKVEETDDILSKSFQHDINNLVNLAQGYRQLSEELNQKQETRKAIEKAEEAEKQIHEMYNRLESNQNEYDKSFQEIIGNSLETLRPKIQKENKNVEIYWNSTSYDCNTCMMTERMIYNLLDNSLDHGNGDITLEIQQLEDYVELELTDGGALTENEFQQIFCNEYQEDKYLSTGSYLIDTIAHKINAEIQPGQDSDYNIKIPLQ